MLHPFTVRLTERTYQKLRSSCFKDNVAFQDVAELAFAAYLADSAAERKKIRNPFRGISPEESRLLLSFLNLLRDGPEDARLIVVSALRYVAKTPRPRKMTAARSLKR